MSNSLKKKACCCVFAASVTLGTLQLWPAEAVLAPNNEAPAAAVNLAAGGNPAAASLVQHPMLAPLALSQADNYTLKLFTEDTVLKNPNADATGYIYLYGGNKIADGAVLDLWYSYSPTTKDNLSMMSVEINGVPVASRQLSVQAGQTSNWQVPLPAKYLKPGANAVTVHVVHRSIDGLCRDIDDPANWFIIHPETRVSFQLMRAPYTLSSFPGPFLDDYMAAKINTVFYVPENPDPELLGAVFNMASNWGGKGLSGLPQRMELRYGEAGQVPANEIVLNNDAAALKLTTLPTGFHQLQVSGPDSASIAGSLNALTRPQLVKTLSGTEMELSVPLPAPKEGQQYFKKSAGKKGTYTLSDLGHEEDLTAAGAFHQEVDIEVPRPAGYGIGDGSYVELHFRHSPILDPKKSAVTIYVNDIPVRAQALLAENAEQGVLKAPIPESELQRASWRIRFGFYHDLGIIDCSKRYDEVAWSVVEKDTAVYLEPGDVYHEASWEYFPGDIGADEQNMVSMTMVLPDAPSQEELTAAFKLAYYIGVQNKKPVHWQVQKASSFDASKAEGAIIALGKNDDTAGWKQMQDVLPVAPEQGGYKTADWIDAAKSGLSGFDICEIGRTKNDKLVYAFLYSTPERLNQLIDHTLSAGNSLSGQVSLVDAQGQVSSFTQPVHSAKGSVLSWFHKVFSGTNNTAGVYAAIVAVVTIATGLLLFFMRKR